MSKLLSANFSRLRKSKLFWLLLAGAFLFSLATIFNAAGSAETMAANGYIRSLDDYFFDLAPYMGIFYAVFISMFLGTEYSDGTMRNKLAVGHVRGHVFLANYLTSFAACLALAAMWILGSAPGRFLIGPFEMGLRGFATYLLVVVGFTAVYAAIFTFISSLSSSKAATVLLTLAAWLLLIFLASQVNGRLSEPEMSGGMAYIDGAFQMIDPTPNPLYLGGNLRTFFECVLDLLPSGQSILMHDASITHPARQVLFSILVTVLTLAGGMAAFRKKDIK